MGRLLDAIAWLISRFIADVIIDGRHVATFRGLNAHRRAADFALGWTVRGMHDRRRKTTLRVFPDGNATGESVWPQAWELPK